MFLKTWNNEKIIDSGRIQEVRLTDEEYPKDWMPNYYEAGAYFIVLDYLNSKGKIETVFYEVFPILDEEFADDDEVPNTFFGTKQDYLESVAFEEAQEEMQKLCRKINKKNRKQNSKQVA